MASCMSDVLAPEMKKKVQLLHQLTEFGRFKLHGIALGLNSNNSIFICFNLQYLKDLNSMEVFQTPSDLGLILQRKT